MKGFRRGHEPNRPGSGTVRWSLRQDPAHLEGDGRGWRLDLTITCTSLSEARRARLAHDLRALLFDAYDESRAAGALMGAQLPLSRRMRPAVARILARLGFGRGRADAERRSGVMSCERGDE